MAKSRFAGLAAVQVSQSGVFFSKDFIGEVEIDATKGFKSQNGKGELFVVECTVTKSQFRPKKLEDGTMTEDPDPVGAARSWMVFLDTVMGLPNLKGFLVAATGFDLADTDTVEKEFDPGCVELAESCQDAGKNPLKGARVALRTRNIETKAGKDFTRHDWSPA